MSLEWTHLKNDDAEGWSALTTAVAKHDGVGYGLAPEVAAEELGSDLFDLDNDSFAVWDQDRLIAWSRVAVPERPRYDGKAQAMISGGVHPDWRDRGIGTELLERSEERASQILIDLHPDQPHVLHVDSVLDGHVTAALLDAAGFRRVRYFQDMRLDTSTPRDLDNLSRLGQGILVRPLEMSDLEEVRLAHNDAFRNHWGWAPTTAKEWADEWDTETFRPELSRVAVNPQGRVLAYTLVSQRSGEQPYIEYVGARPETRGMGLGRAAISEVVRGAIESPEVTALYLDVDADSPSKAGNLYTDLGFEVIRTWGSWEKDLG